MTCAPASARTDPTCHATLLRLASPQIRIGLSVSCRKSMVSIGGGGWQLPAERHVRFDGLLRFVQVGTRIEHVQADGMDLVAGGAGQTITGRVARVGGPLDPQEPL